MTKKNMVYFMDIGKNKSNMLRDPSYVPRNTSSSTTTIPKRKSIKHQGSTFSRNNPEYDEEANTFPITTPINQLLEKISRNGQLNENIRKIIKILQTKYLPEINKLERLLLENPTYLYITKILGISKENALRITGAVATLAVIYAANSIVRRHKSMVLDAFIYATPALSIYDILKKEPELLDGKKKRRVSRFLDNQQMIREEYTKTHQLKTWMVYLIVCSLFNITDNFFINRTKPAIETSVTQTVITTTPYLLRDTNKQVFTTIAQVTPFSERFFSALSQYVKNTVKYSWYWVLKFVFAYWMGYKDGREILYHKMVIPFLRKYYEYELKSNRSISEMDMSFEESESFSKSDHYTSPSNHQPKASSNTRDQGLQPSTIQPFSTTSTNDSLGYYRPRESSRKDEFLDHSSRNVDGYYSDSYYESSEPINIRLNNSGIFSSVKYSNSTNRMIQNSDSLSVEDPWKNISFIGNSNIAGPGTSHNDNANNSNGPVKRNRSFSLNSINHSNNSLNNYRATIYDANNRLSEYYNDTSFERDPQTTSTANKTNVNNVPTFYYNSLK